MSESADLSVSGNDDHWMLFDRLTSDGYPLIVLTRTGNPSIDASIASATMTVVICRADADLVNDRGMPQNSDRLYPLEDALADRLQAQGAGTFHVASVTGDGLRQIVYCHALIIDFAAIVSEFDIEGYALNVETPGNRDQWLNLLTPTVLERQLDGDRGVVSNLAKNGDDGLVVRKTDFWFYGQREALETLITDLSPRGYHLDHWLDEADGVVLTTETTVDIETFHEITPLLLDSANRHQVRYDGWETFVVQPLAGVEQEAPQKPTSLLSRLFGAKK